MCELTADLAGDLLYLAMYPAEQQCAVTTSLTSTEHEKTPSMKFMHVVHILGTGATSNKQQETA